MMDSFLILTIITVLLCFGICSLIFKKANIVYIFVMSAATFFCSHIISTMGLFVIDKYSLFRGMAATFALDFILFLIILFFKSSKLTSFRQLFSFDFNIKPFIIPILVSVMAMPLTANKNELFGMGQDEGVYQCVAINFINGLDSRQQDFEEYHTLQTDEERELFERYVNFSLVGYDIPTEDYPDTVYDRDVSKVSGIYHGIPTFAAILAMWGQLFGIENMMTVETVFYIITIFLVFFICNNLRLSRVSGLIACILTAVSPIVIWVSKSALTEMFLAVLMALFILFLTDDGNKRFYVLSIIPIAVFGCYHVSIYTILPYVLIIYGGMYLFTRRKVFAILMPVTVMGYMISYFSMRQVQPFYTMNNYRVLFVNGINVNNISNIIAFVCPVLTLVCIIYIFIINKAGKNFNRIRFMKNMQKNPVMAGILSAILISPVLVIIIRATMEMDSFKEAGKLTIVGFIMASGIILVPVAYIVSVINSRFFLRKTSYLVIFISFFYCVIIYSTFLRYEIDYYYYYSRYLAPFIPIAIIFSLLVLDRFGKKTVLPLSLASLVFTAPYTYYLMGHKDDTRMRWGILNSLSEYITENDCIIIDSANRPTLWLPLRAMTGASVFPQLSDDLKSQIFELNETYENVYFISSDSYVYDPENYLEVVYMNEIHCSEDENVFDEEYIFFPESFSEYDRDIYLYRALDYDYYYDSLEIFKWSISGFHKSESNFCWTKEQNASVRCRLEPDDYELTLELGCNLPLGEISKNSLNSLRVNLYVNSILTDTVYINGETNGKSVTFDIPANYIKDGSNIIEFESEIWSASVVSSGDDRTLGIPIKSLFFDKK